MDKYKVIAAHYAEVDNIQARVRETEKGIFGASEIADVYEFFTTIELNKAKQFIDLGSGDGRVVCVASLFTKAIGLEFDEQLIKESKEHAEKVGCSAEFIQVDYETYDYSETDIIFCYADHDFSETFLEKLRQEFKGTMYVYQGAFLPKLPKGQTFWAGQTPLISYEFE